MAVRITNILEMDHKYDDVVVSEINRERGGAVICAGLRDSTGGLVRVWPPDAYQHFSRRGIYPTIEELKEYVTRNNGNDQGKRGGKF